MEPPPKAAANSRGASILVAVAYQKSPSLMVPDDVLATSVSPAAARRAPGQVRAAGNGDHGDRGQAGRAGGVEALDTTPRRPPVVDRVLDEVGLDAGGDHRSFPAEDGRDGQAEVLYDWVGPKTITDWAGSEATICLPDSSEDQPTRRWWTCTVRRTHDQAHGGRRPRAQLRRSLDRGHRSRTDRAARPRPRRALPPGVVPGAREGAAAGAGYRSEGRTGPAGPTRGGPGRAGQPR